MATQSKAQKIRALQNKIDNEKSKKASSAGNLVKLRAELKHVRKGG